MIKGYLGRVKVDKSIKPINFNKRTALELVIGKEYFVSFGNNETYPCKLINIIQNPMTEIEIEIPMRPMSKKGFLNSKGNYSHHWVSTHVLYANEIGVTREEAVINQVSS